MMAAMRSDSFTRSSPHDSKHRLAAGKGGSDGQDGYLVDERGDFGGADGRRDELWGMHDAYVTDGLGAFACSSRRQDMLPCDEVPRRRPYASD